MTTKVYPFTIPDSGITVNVRGLSPSMITVDIMKAIPKPPPPGQLVDFGNGDKRFEYNYAHPDYPKILEEWQLDVELKAVNAIILRSLVKELNDEEKAEVAAVREEMGGIGITLDRSDKLVWWKYIAISSDGDTQALMEFLGKRAEPKPEVVKAIQDSFRGDIQE